MVGVIANLAIYFALRTLFDQTTRADWGSVSVDLPVLTSPQSVALGTLPIRSVDPGSGVQHRSGGDAQEIELA